MRGIIKFGLLISICVICFGACSSRQWFTNKTVVEIGESDKFSGDEIQSAADLVTDEETGYENCSLLSVCYDEEKSDAAVKSYMEHGRGKDNNVSEENVIVMLSSFKTYGEQPVLNSNHTYENYRWILIRDSESSPWRIDDRGY